MLIPVLFPLFSCISFMLDSSKSPNRSPGALPPTLIAFSLLLMIPSSKECTFLVRYFILLFIFVGTNLRVQWWRRIIYVQTYISNVVTWKLEGTFRRLQIWRWGPLSLFTHLFWVSLTSILGCRLSGGIWWRAQLVPLGAQRFAFPLHSYCQMLFEKSHRGSDFAVQAMHLARLILLLRSNYPISSTSHCSWNNKQESWAATERWKRSVVKLHQIEKWRRTHISVHGNYFEFL